MLFYARAHFSCRFVGKGYRQDPKGRYSLSLDQPGDPLGQNTGFAATSPSQNQGAAGRRCDGSALLRIERF